MMTECANCYTITECIDDGGAYICADRATCQQRATTSGETGLSSIISEGVLFIPPQEDNECLTCNGRGGMLSGEMQGDGYMTGWVEFFEDCPDCIGSGKCPGCGAPMTPEQQAQAEHDIESFTCSVDICSWHYDADRFYAREPEWGDYD